MRGVTTGDQVAQTASRTLDPEEYRDVIGYFASGVTVITTCHDDRDYGTTASAVTSLSLEPPMLLACLNRTSETGHAVEAVGRFAVNILSDSQGALAARFAGKGPDKFAGVDRARGAGGLPLLTESLARLECDVVERASGGTHVIFVAEVTAASASRGTPLAYFRGGFGRFVDFREDPAYHALRRMVLDRSLPVGAPLRIADAAERLGIDLPAAVHAVSRLVQDGLVRLEGATQYSVRPVDERVMTEALRARLALELGAVNLVVEDLSEHQIETITAAAEAAVPTTPATPEQLNTYAAAIRGWHETLMRLAGNEPLFEAYERLNVPAVLARAVWKTDWSSLHARLAKGRLRIAAALAARDRAAVCAALVDYTEETRRGTAEVMHASGGRA
jgi:flavin reductase (DIM6/NTAB) family NADH-FMN oxidoreductase RutF/DNA-binding GntR family transcriptional regulator